MLGDKREESSGNVYSDDEYGLSWRAPLCAFTYLYNSCGRSGVRRRVSKESYNTYHVMTISMGTFFSVERCRDQPPMSVA